MDFSLRKLACRIVGILVALLAVGVWASLPQEHRTAATSPPSLPAIEFRNIAAQARVKFILNNSPTPQKYQIEPMVGGVAVIDYNNDGWPDLYFTNGARIPDLEKSGPEYYNRLFRNNGDGTFTDVTEQAGVKGDGYSMGVAVGDYDNDGRDDLFVAGVNRNTLYRNNGDGTFTDVTVQAGLSGIDPERGKMWSIAAGWFDYDNDGWLDLFVANYCVWGLDKDPYCGSARTGHRVYCHPSKFGPLPNTLYHNNHDGTFTDVSKEAGIAEHLGKGMGVAFADYDGDGYPDVFVANDTARNFLFHNKRDGSFEEVGLQLGVAYNGDGAALSYMGTDFRDVDNDGFPDVFVTAISNETFSYFHNVGGRFFEDFTPTSGLGRLSIFMSGWSNGIYDLNNDGWKDLVAVNSHVNDKIELEMNVPFRQPNAVFANARDRFVDVSREAGADFQVPAAHRGAAFADLDNDGKVDLVDSILNAPAEIFRNVSEGSGHWLLVKTVGTASNRDGLGAKLRVETASGVQYNQVTTSVGYASSSDRRVHFGLGGDNVVKSLEILWPSGRKQVLHDIKADQILTVTEPAR